jgi:2-keto-4-pentenoate hydratase/2-oxohepta-3-ene-1,7-dioic acid hydratase in catechol pathway
MQDAPTSGMIRSVARIIAEVSRGTTLAAGTVVLTGTPAGVGFGRKPPVFLKDGDVVEVEIAGVGRVRNPVRHA